VKRRFYQHRPDMSVRYVPRVPHRLRGAVNVLCKRNDLPEVDALRYCFEAATLLVRAHKLRLLPVRVGPKELDAAVTLRMSRAMAARVVEIYHREQENDRETTFADILRMLVRTGIDLARRRGIAHVMGVREQFLRR
jgi:hypothetical protein